MLVKGNETQQRRWLGPVCRCSSPPHSQLTVLTAGLLSSSDSRKPPNASLRTHRDSRPNSQHPPTIPLCSPAQAAPRAGFQILQLPFVDPFLFSSSHSYVRTDSYNNFLILVCFSDWLADTAVRRMVCISPVSILRYIPTHSCFLPLLFP